MGSFLMMTCFLCTTISSGMFITAMAANPLAVNLAAETLGYTISWGGCGPGGACRQAGQQPGGQAGRQAKAAASEAQPELGAMACGNPATGPRCMHAPVDCRSMSAGTWALAGLVPGLACLLLTPALMYVLYPPEVKDTPDAPAKVSALRHAAAAVPLLARRMTWVGPPSHAPLHPMHSPPPLSCVLACVPACLQAREALAKLGPMSTEEKSTAGAFAITVGLWIFGGAIGVNAVAAALTGLSILLVTGACGALECAVVRMFRGDASAPRPPRGNSCAAVA